MAFLGGSAFSMAKDVGEGYVLLNAMMLKKLTNEEIRKLRFELERVLNNVRGGQPPIDDLGAIQLRNRKITRLNSALMMVNHQLRSR